MSIDRDTTVGADHRTVGTACAGVRIGHPRHGITLAVDLCRECQNVAGTRRHTDAATFAPLVIDQNFTFNFCHIRRFFIPCTEGLTPRIQIYEKNWRIRYFFSVFCRLFIGIGGFLALFDKLGALPVRQVYREPRRSACGNGCSKTTEQRPYNRGPIRRMAGGRIERSGVGVQNGKGLQQLRVLLVAGGVAGALFGERSLDGRL